MILHIGLIGRAEKVWCYGIKVPSLIQRINLLSRSFFRLPSHHLVTNPLVIHMMSCTVDSLWRLFPFHITTRSITTTEVKAIIRPGRSRGNIF